MQFKVPQFLEIEDKIFGPLTFKEFAYLVGGGGICFVLYKAFGVLFGAVPILLVAGLSLALTFYRPNNKPFIDMLESMFKYATQSKLYIWKRNKFIPGKAVEKTEVRQTGGEALNRAERLSGSRLRDLAWSLDVLDLKK